MKIFDKEFAFSGLNANDIERLEQAKARMDQAEETERQRTAQQSMSYAEGIRGQCSIIETFIDEVLGEGAARSLGLDGNDLGKALTVMTEMTRAASEESKRFSQSVSAAVPMNRAQRRRKRHHA